MNLFNENGTIQTLMMLMIFLNIGMIFDYKNTLIEKNT